MTLEETLARHERIALQFSGGKDSLALLELMKPYWDRLTVYWFDSGDSFPEVRELMARVAETVPHFEHLQGNQPAVIEKFGIPSDLVPANSTQLGAMMKNGGTLLQDRYQCCWRTLMIPLHQRMKQDGITLVIRGQKASDAMRAPLRTGSVDDGIEYLFPLEDWDDSQVFDFLREHNIELPSFYGKLGTSLDCMTCSAYWEEGRGAYLKEHHPEAYEEYQRRLNAISAATAEPIMHFNLEIG